VIRKRWDSDDRGRGVASGDAFAEPVAEFGELMAQPGWIAEEPEAHLLPHLVAACAEPDSTLELTSTETVDDIFVVELTAKESARSTGELRRAAVGLLAAFAEEATFIRQRQDGDVLEFDVATGTAPAEARFAPHGHLVRLRIRPRV